jgi:DNA-binding CsgD family transcriptional regulator
MRKPPNNSGMRTPHSPGSSRTTSTQDRARVVGRTAELELLTDALLDPAHLPSVVLLTGEAGIGKTTVMRAVVGAARDRGFRVLATTGAAAEARLSLAGARDLVGTVALEDMTDDVPAPQRRALDVLLLRGEPGIGVPNRSAIAAAVLSLILGVAARGPVLMAIDDAQWVDPASLAIVSYALRRLAGAPIAAILSWRDTGEGKEPPFDAGREGWSVVPVGPLSIGALGSMLHEQLPEPVSRPTLRRIHETAGGNPLHSLELGRAHAEHPSAAEPGAPLRLPQTLRDLLRRRIGGLPRQSIEALRFASALAHPRVSTIERVMSAGARPAIDRAVEADVVEIEDDQIRFRHPLLRATVYELTPPDARRRIHLGLAGAVDDVEERGRHLALGTAAPDAVIAAQVEAAADLAFARGDPAAAADLAASAARLTPAGARHAEALQRRTLAEVDHRFAAGDARRTAELLDGLLAEAAAGPGRAMLLARRARVHHFADDIATSVDVLRSARAEAGDDALLVGEIEDGLAWGLMMIRSDLGAAAEHARAAAEIAERRGEPAAVAEALATLALAECLAGRPWSATIERALGLEPSAADLRVLRQPSFAYAYILSCTHAFDQARTVWLELARRAARQGDESAMPSICNHHGLVELLSGRWPEAETLLTEGSERAVETGQRPSGAALLGKRALLAAWRGDFARAREDANEALRSVAGIGFDGSNPGVAIAAGGESAIWALGHSALAEGNPGAASHWLTPLREALLAGGLREPGEMPWLGDEVEALVASNRTAEATELVETIAAIGAQVDRGFARAIANRGRGLLCGIRGDADGERAALEDAVTETAVLGIPFEHARTLLAAGLSHRRRHAWRAARETLGDAHARFEALGATAWASRAQREIARVGGRPVSTEALSPTEREVATLVAGGRTNREVAAALFLSVRTVEAALTRIYGKLGVRSRTELARTFDSPRDP